MSVKVSANKNSFSHEVYPRDIEHLSPNEISNYYEDIAKSVLKMPSEYYLKIYYDEGKIYVDTDNPDFELAQAKAKACPWLLEKLIGEVPLDSALNHGDHIKIGGKYLRFLHLTEFPKEALDQGHFNSLDRYYMVIKQIPNAKASLLLDSKRKVFHSDNSGVFANYKSEAGEDQAEELLEQVQLNLDGLFEVEFWFWVLADTEAEMAEQTKIILDHFKHNDGKARIETLGLTEAFLSYLPGFLPALVGPIVTTSDYLLGLMPLSRDHLHDSGILLYSISDKKVFFDIFSGSNFNTAIIGHSGSGKTFLTQKIIDYYLASGIKAVIVDRGESCDRLARYHNGTIFANKVNPLQFKNPSFLTEFLCSFIPHGVLSYRQKCILFNSIQKHIKTIKTLDELFKIVDKEIPDFSIYLNQYRDFFTDQKIRPSDITYVNTRNYPENFLRPLFIYLSEYISNLSGNKVFVFEECWHALSHNVDYIGEFFRTSRARGISCIAVTQRFDDLLNSEIGKIIAENTYFKILFSVPQKKNEYLDEYDLEYISELKSQENEFSEFFLKTPFIRKPLRYYPSVLEHERFTSNYDHRKQIDQFISKYEKDFDYKTLIKRWTELKYGTNIHRYLAHS